MLCGPNRLGGFDNIHGVGFHVKGSGRLGACLFFDAEGFAHGLAVAVKINSSRGKAYETVLLADELRLVERHNDPCIGGFTGC